MSDKDLYCTGKIYKKSIGGYIYWNLSHVGVDYCPMHDDLNKVERLKDNRRLKNIRAAIAKCPEHESSSNTEEQDIRPRPSFKHMAIYTTGFFLMLFDGWKMPLLGIILTIYSSFNLGFYLYTINAPVDNVENLLIKRQYAIEKQKEARYRWKVWIIANWTMKREISYHLTRIGFAHIMRTGGGTMQPNMKVSRPKLSKPFIGTDSITYKVVRMPFRSYLSDILDDRTTLELSLSLGRECQAHERNDGVYLEVMLKSGVGGIKDVFPWESRETETNAIGMMPMKPPRLVIPFGIGRGRKFFYGDLTSTTINHMLVAGSTGGGKSNFINQLICTWIRNADNRMLNFYMVDLKRVELLDYADLPHLKMPIVTDPEKVYPVLDEIYNIIKQRAEIMEGHARNIKQWNGKVVSRKVEGNIMPYIVLLIDELAECAAIDGWRKHGEKRLIQIIQLGRAMGVHVVLATQIVKSSVLGTLATANIPCRVCFPVGSINGSMLIVETKTAYELPRIPGRAVFVSGANRTEVQTPFITNEQIKETVAAAIERCNNLTGKVSEFDVDQLIEIALAQDPVNGSIAVPGIPAIKELMGYSEYKARKGLDDITYNFDEQRPVIDYMGNKLIIVNNGAGWPRSLHAVNGKLPESIDEIPEVEIDINI